jgi:low temperature requirement protein LtrA
MNLTKAFLVFAAVGLTPIALGYGAAPGVSLQWLFDIDASSVNSSHIFRAVMGLYLALVLFWLAGAVKPGLQYPALWSLAVFMLGLAAGRILSLVLDGLPHPLLIIYLVLEIIMGIIALILIRKHEAAG